MKKIVLARLVVLLLAIAGLSGCYWGPRGIGHFHQGGRNSGQNNGHNNGHDNSHSGRGEHDSDHD